MKKNAFKVLLSFMLVVCMMPLPLVFADEEVQPAQEEETVQASQEESTLPLTEGLEEVVEIDTPSVIPEEVIAPQEEGGFTTLAEAEEAGAVSGVPDDPQAYVSDEILVVLAGEGSEAKELAAVEESIATLSVEESTIETEVLTPEPGESPVVVVELPTDVTVEDALVQMANDESVLYAQPNFVYSLLEADDEEIEATYEPTFTPNDPYTKSSAGGAYQWWLASVNAFNAWDIKKTNKDVTVAVLDTGIYLGHADLDDNISSLAYNLVDAQHGKALTSSLGTGGDVSGHGTHVAGIIAAEANNNSVGAGVSYNAKILPIAIFRPDGVATTDSVIAAIGYVISKRSVENIKVINMSFGDYSVSDGLFHQKIIDARNVGILFVAAAGNGNTSATCYPSDWPEVVSVTATDSSNNRAYFSDYNGYKDIAAPGVSIVSTYYAGPVPPTVSTTYSSGSSRAASMSGTSMASPVVAGVAALLFAYNPNLTPTQVEQALYSSATDRGAPGRDDYYGYGIVNAQAALQAVADVIPTELDGAVVTISSILATDKIFDIPGQSTTKGVSPALWTNGYTPNQRFRLKLVDGSYFTLTNVKSGLVLDLSRSKATNGNTISQWTSSGTDNQKWKLIRNANSSFTIASKIDTSFCLDLPGSRTSKGTQPGLWKRGSNQANQQFFLNVVSKPLANGVYAFQSVKFPGSRIDIQRSSTANGAAVLLWTASGNNNQKYQFTYNTSTGYYTIYTKTSNPASKVLDASTRDSTITQWASHGGFNQQWYLVPTGSAGSYYVYSAASGKVLDVSGSGSAVGASILVWSWHGGNNQRWVLPAA